MKAIVAVLTLMSLSLAGCSDDKACSSDSDCFSGEYCDEGACRGGERPVEMNNGTNNIGTDSGNNATNNVANPDVGPDVNTGSSNNNATNNATNNGTIGMNGECIIDPFGNTCDDDEFEENDDRNDPNLATDQSAWCDAGDLARPVQSFSGTLCPGDAGDFYRLQIDNRPPDECLADRFTIRITVELDQSCAPDALDIRPHTFFDNPDIENLCSTDENLRCRIEPDERTYVFDWARDTEQLVDPRLMIRPLRDDVELSYTVTVEVIQ